MLLPTSGGPAAAAAACDSDPDSDWGGRAGQRWGTAVYGCGQGACGRGQGAAGCLTWMWRQGVVGYNLIWMWDRAPQMAAVLDDLAAAVAWRPPHVHPPHAPPAPAHTPPLTPSPPPPPLSRLWTAPQSPG